MTLAATVCVLTRPVTHLKRFWRSEVTFDQKIHCGLWKPSETCAHCISPFYYALNLWGQRLQSSLNSLKLNQTSQI